MFSIKNTLDIVKHVTVMSGCILILQRIRYCILSSEHLTFKTLSPKKKIENTIVDLIKVAAPQDK